MVVCYFQTITFQYNINMSLFDWEKAWERRYNNNSDERWKTKSLNPMQSESYEIKLPPKQKTVAAGKEGVQKQQKDKEELLPSPRMTKINESMFCISLERELNVFYLQQDDRGRKSKKTFSKAEYKLDKKIKQVAGLAISQEERYILVGTENSLIVLKVVQEPKKDMEAREVTYTIIKPQEKDMPIPDFRMLVCFGKNRIIALSSTHLHQFQLVQDKLRELTPKKIQFATKEEENALKVLTPIGIVVGGGHCLYYFGSKEDKRVDVSKLKGSEENPNPGRCQALSIIRLEIKGKTDIDNVRGEVFPIDYIFELGMFTRTKIYQIQEQTFLFSLHEEIILIKKNFNKYIVWDNVSVVSSKSQSKKGQLILIAQTILVYSEPLQIYAHQILFNQEDSKLQMPTIDNFRGNQNDELVLYDALMLGVGSENIMKVLVYTKQVDVIYPANGSPYRKQQTDPNKMKESPTTLDFAVICINQNQPKKKLQALIVSNIKNNKPTTQQIDVFCERFNISPQDLTKCKWNVSAKKLKDIQGILMEIKDDAFIQSELDNILKQESHTLEFLLSVENKQAQRLKGILIEKVIEYTNNKNPKEKAALKKYLFNILKWMMESEMFLKKIAYSKQFLTFKQYDFIQIGKLRAASLKEEIKLLSCKKYEKRLKHFINAFSILVIANFEEVFNFLLIDKSIIQIQEFIKAFPFILPKFVEESKVFIKRKQYNIINKNLPIEEYKSPGKKRERHMSFNPSQLLVPPQKREREKSRQKKGNQDRKPSPPEKGKTPEKDKTKGSKIKGEKGNSGQNVEGLQEKSSQVECLLWSDISGKTQITQTIEVFLKDRIEEIKQQQNLENKELAEQNLKSILEEFQGQQWFITAAFKQHCMITKTTEQIHAQFNDLKTEKAFKILIKFLYGLIVEAEKKDKLQGENISSYNNQAIGEQKKSKKQILQKQINEMLDQFIMSDVIPESFKRNVDARVQVYELLKPLAKPNPDKKIITIQLPNFQQFVVKGQAEYFAQIFEHIRSKILTSVKTIYDDIEVGFFQERFQLFLKSSLIKPQDVIGFLDEFTEEVAADDIRLDVFNAIKRLLKLEDKENTQKYIQNSLDKEILPERGDGHTGKLRDEAKIPYGYNFYWLFLAFNINYTYEELIGFTNQNDIKQNKIINQLVFKYCRNQYKLSEDYDGKQVCTIKFEDCGGINEKLPETDIHNEPLQFFGVLLILLDNLDFLVEEQKVFELIMENYLNVNKFIQLSHFITKLKNYHITQDNMSTKNYQMISDFKEEIDIDQTFIQYTLQWIKRNYDIISDVEQLDDKMSSILSALNMLEVFSKNSVEIKKQRALYDILSCIKKFQPSLVKNVEQIKVEAVSHGSFIFLMHLFNKIGIERFTSVDQLQDEPAKVECFFRIFESHQQHVLSQKVDYYHPDFIRFLIEVCLKTIEANKFRMAKYLILYKIPNDNEYFMDVMLMFLAAVQVDKYSLQSLYQDIIKMILTPQTTSLIKNNLQKIINKYNFKNFIQINPLMRVDAISFLKVEMKENLKGESKMFDERMEDGLQFYQRACDMFENAMSKFRKHDAFFFLIRARIVRNDSLKNVVNKSSISYQQQDQKIEVMAFFLITTYLKVLEKYVQRQFYPTFRFFQSKLMLLNDPKERFDIIKDINIAMSKLERLFYKNEKHRPLYDLKTQLENYYTEYMGLIGLDPDIKLVDVETRGTTATVKAQMFTRTKNQYKDDQLEKQINQHKKAIQLNINKAHQVQEDSRYNVLNRQVAEQITEIKKASERHAQLQAEMAKQKDGKDTNIAARKAKEIEEIKRKEKQDIQSIKDTYKSNTTKRVNDLIQNLRKRRQQIKTKTYAPTSAVRQDLKQVNFGPRPTVNIRPPATNQFQPQTPKSDMLSQQMVPITMRGRMQKKISGMKEQQRKGDVNKFVDLQKRVFPEPTYEPYSTKKKLTFDDIARLYKDSQSEEALKSIQKYDMVRKPDVRAQMLKRAYVETKKLDNFLQFLKFLLESDPSWKESIEEKSIPVAAQMLKMQPKEKITIKQIIPAQLFTKLFPTYSPKDYYPMVFQMFKPTLKKIFEKDLMAVHAVGIFFRYSLGSENKFYNKVFYEYFSVILKTYELKNYDDKELTLLAEKLRSNYSNLPDNKIEVLEELLSKITNQSKKTRLFETLIRLIDRRGESMVGGAANKEISYVIQKLMKT